MGLQLPNLTKTYRTPLIITGLVTAIATYHYVRIFNSWVNAFDLKQQDDSYAVSLSGVPFNDAYRYVDWLLTVPLLLIELILVMRLPAEESASLSWKLGASSAIMVALGYPGEIQNDLGARWFWWACAMVPFAYVVITQARYLTAISWLTYPFVYIIKSVGISGPVATTWEQAGYSVADFSAKAVFGVLIWAIAAEKSKLEGEGSLIPSECCRADSLVVAFLIFRPASAVGPHVPRGVVAVSELLICVAFPALRGCSITRLVIEAFVAAPPRRFAERV